ncbi:hypothetical protein M3610_10390 [Neobacillus sp. MER 74]|uniref:hypothetical protein n=1 Tax=Neobacillus sp. MER 74 TaxID=2939566 RepID=UPI00203DA087|nr:hypothetical protein [Neobacillus sp. MER 74]MCM3115696.1 hypothetical protein [Neobacillus sp. MER 74]
MSDEIQKRIDEHKRSINSKLSKEEKLKIVADDKQLLEHITNQELEARSKLQDSEWIVVPEGMSIKDFYRLKLSIENAKDSLGMSGNLVSEEQEQLVRDRLSGKLSEEEFFKKALELAKGEENV